MKTFRLLITKKLSAIPVEKSLTENVAITQMEFIKIEPLSNSSIKEMVHQLCREETVVIFTSKNAVQAVSSITQSSCSTWKIFCMNGTTKEHVIQLFGEISIAGSASNAAALANIIADRKIKKAIFFCGNKRRDELPSILLSKGIIVEEIVVYETVLSPKKMPGTFDGVSFFSPSSAESFFSINALPESTVCFSIGSTTTNALKKYTNNTILTSATSSETSMIDLVEAYVKKNNGKIEE